MIEYRIAPAGRTTGLLLQELVGPNPVNAVVCYGSPYSGPLPALNGNSGRLNKLEQALRLTEGLGAQAIRSYSFEQALHVEVHGPMLGRKLVHTQGKDIVPILERWQLEATRGICDFYTPYVPSVGEYRTWVYRNRHLGTYKKVLAHPEQFKRLGRNYRNGFVFERVENDDVPQAVKQLSRQAVRALDLDFGAVDLLDTASGLLVLEVNSAPGVADSRRAVINSLAHRVQRWAANGCPGRSHAE
jgi:RimK-like ATP-grasp domain